MSLTIAGPERRARGIGTVALRTDLSPRPKAAAARAKRLDSAGLGRRGRSRDPVTSRSDRDAVIASLLGQEEFQSGAFTSFAR